MNTLDRIAASVFKLALAALFLLAFSATAGAWPGRVVGVHDADTIVVERQDGSRAKIRLFGVDAPEIQLPGRWKTQPYARVATKFVQAMLLGDSDETAVTIFEMGKSYDRVVGAVIQLENGLTVQEELLRAGLAWVDPRYCRKSIPECEYWFGLQAVARENGVGLWQDPDAIPPWEWRRGD